MSSIIVTLPNIAKEFNVPTYTTNSIPSNLSSGELLYNLDTNILYFFDGYKLVDVNNIDSIKKPEIYTTGLIFEMDSSYSNVYPGSGSTIFDASHKLNNLSLPNGIGYSSSNETYFDFNGSTQRAVGPTSLSGRSTTSMTLEILTKPDSTTQSTTLMSKWGRSSLGNFSWLLFLNWFAQGNLYFLVGNSAGSSYSSHSIPHQFSTSQYTHFAVTYNAGAIRMYRNGEFISASSTANTSLKDVSTYFGVGHDYDTGTGDNPYRHYDGKIPLARVYNTVLTDAQIQNNFNSIKARFGL